MKLGVLCCTYRPDCMYACCWMQRAVCRGAETSAARSKQRKEDGGEESKEVTEVYKKLSKARLHFERERRRLYLYLITSYMIRNGVKVGWYGFAQPPLLR